MEVSVQAEAPQGSARISDESLRNLETPHGRDEEGGVFLYALTPWEDYFLNRSVDEENRRKIIYNASLVISFMWGRFLDSIDGVEMPRTPSTTNKIDRGEPVPSRRYVEDSIFAGAWQAFTRDSDEQVS